MISGIRQFLYFTLHYKLQPWPVSVDTLTCFLEFMARTSGFPHLKHLLCSVKFLHEELDQPFPTISFMVDMTMPGLKRRLARVPFQVLLLTPVIQKEIGGGHQLDLRVNKWSGAGMHVRMGRFLTGNKL